MHFISHSIVEMKIDLDKINKLSILIKKANVKHTETLGYNLNKEVTRATRSYTKLNSGYYLSISHKDSFEPGNKTEENFIISASCGVLAIFLFGKDATNALINGNDTIVKPVSIPSMFEICKILDGTIGVGYSTTIYALLPKIRTRLINFLTFRLSKRTDYSKFDDIYNTLYLCFPDDKRERHTFDVLRSLKFTYKQFNV